VEEDVRYFFSLCAVTQGERVMFREKKERLRRKYESNRGRREAGAEGGGVAREVWVRLKPRVRCLASHI
jgi:hypothetical protein